MKPLRLLFSCYIMALFLMPCSDVQARTDVVNDVSLESVEHGHSHESDHCSPLCICGCCSMTVSVHLHRVYLAEPQSELLPQQESFSYLTPFLPGFFENIWQPPRLQA